MVCHKYCYLSKNWDIMLQAVVYPIICSSAIIIAVLPRAKGGGAGLLHVSHLPALVKIISFVIAKNCFHSPPLSSCTWGALSRSDMDGEDPAPSPDREAACCSSAERKTGHATVEEPSWRAVFRASISGEACSKMPEPLQNSYHLARRLEWNSSV